jgi:hypothetical protein
MPVDPNVHPGITSSMPQWLQKALNTAWLAHPDNPINKAGTQPTNIVGGAEGPIGLQQSLVTPALKEKGILAPKIESAPPAPLQQNFGTGGAEGPAGLQSFLARQQASADAFARQTGASARSAAINARRNAVRPGQTFNPANFFSDIVNNINNIVASLTESRRDVPIPGQEPPEGFIEDPDFFDEANRVLDTRTPVQQFAGTGQVSVTSPETQAALDARLDAEARQSGAAARHAAMQERIAAGGYGTRQVPDLDSEGPYDGPHGQVGLNSFVVTDLSDVGLIARAVPGANVYYDNGEDPLRAVSGQAAFIPALEKYLAGEDLPQSVIDALIRMGFLEEDIAANEDFPLPIFTDLPEITYPAYDFGAGPRYRFPSVSALTAGLFNWRISA